VTKRWIRLVQGLRIRQRLKVQYGDIPNAEVPIFVSQMIAPLFCGYTSFQDPSGMDERHVVQPYHLPRQKYTDLTFQDNGQEEDLPDFLPQEGTSKEDEMNPYPSSLQINGDATLPPELVENASSTTHGKTRSAPRRRVPGRRRKTTSSSGENGEESLPRRITQRISITPARSLRARRGKT